MPRCTACSREIESGEFCAPDTNLRQEIAPRGPWNDECERIVGEREIAALPPMPVRSVEPTPDQWKLWHARNARRAGRRP